MRRLQRLLLASAILLGIRTGARGQAIDFKEILTGSGLPQTIKLKDVTGEWRRVTLGVQLDIVALFSLSTQNERGGTPSAADFFTRGQTVKLDTETFLIAYTLKSQTPISALMKIKPQDKEPTKPPVGMTPDTELTLTLLNLRSINTIRDIRPFNIEEEIARAKAEALKMSDTETFYRLKQVGLGVMMYVQDYDEMFPYMKEASATMRVIMPYVKNTNVFYHPLTKEPFRTNPNLSRKSLASIDRPAETVLYYEASPGMDGKRGVCFADGHVKRIPEEEWLRLKQAGKIP